jgi:putative redox protein
MSFPHATWQRASGVTACDVAFADGQAVAADLEPAVGGKGGPTPHDLLDAALAACTTLTLQLYVQRKQMAVERIHVAVTHAQQDGRHVMSRTVQVTGTLTEADRVSLQRIAEACPVHKTLTTGSTVVTQTEVSAG